MPFPYIVAPRERQNLSVPLLGALVLHCWHCLGTVSTLARPAAADTTDPPDGGRGKTGRFS